MGYTSGYHWHVTTVEGKTITWVTAGASLPENARIASVLDPDSTAPARRVLRDGSVGDLGVDEPGLTVYGTHAANRPSLDAFAALAPEYAFLAEALRKGHGITHHRVTGDDPLLNLREVAARIGVQPRTVYRYKADGVLPEPDEIHDGRPQYRASTIDAWAESRPGQGRRTDLAFG